MVSYSVDSDQLQSAVTVAQGSIDAVRGASAQLTGGLSGVQSAWSGQASTAFIDAVDRWRAIQAQVEESAAELNRALSTAAEQYGSTESSILRMFAV